MYILGCHERERPRSRRVKRRLKPQRAFGKLKLPTKRRATEVLVDKRQQQEEEGRTAVQLQAAAC
jgi:hypothetical protein